MNDVPNVDRGHTHQFGPLRPLGRRAVPRACLRPARAGRRPPRRDVALRARRAPSGLAPATLHRLARTLVDLGYLRQEASRRYALGPRLFLLAESSSTMLNSVALPHLAHLVDEIGETANLAMLDGDQVAYVAQAPGRHSMRMFTEVGRRVLPHCTAVGKALLAVAPPTTTCGPCSRAPVCPGTRRTP